MGVRGLQSFMEGCYPETCVPVNLREMSANHAKALNRDCATVVVDGMSCLRHWYSCQSWVHGGQWQEFMHLLHQFVEAFTAAGIRLVFFFDTTVEEGKRREWVTRRLRANQDIARVFHHIKCHGRQPDRDMFCLPSGLATFSRFALKALGQETWCATREGDYEVAEYAARHNCMGILGQDSDFVIYDTAQCLSINSLRLDSMTTVLYSSERLCRVLRLHKAELPLLACLLGNDVVPEPRMRHVRRAALVSYQRTHQKSQGDKVLAVAEFIQSNRPDDESLGVLAALPLPVSDKEVLEKGMRSYLLPGQGGQESHGTKPSSDSACAMERYVSPDILQAARERHVRAECFMVYNVLCDGVVECSNTLEDEEQVELLPQALLYQSIREHIYWLLLPGQPSDSLQSSPSVKEWFVFPGNLLTEPKAVWPKPPPHADGPADLRTMWFGEGPEVRGLQMDTLLSILELQEFAEVLGALTSPMAAVLCLVTYITVKTKHLSLEDVDAYLSQAVCVQFKSHTDLLSTKVSRVDSRAVQLGSLFVRGLTHLIAANSACGSPLPMDHLMPWRTFDGMLFHAKYLLAHSGHPVEELLEGEVSWMPLFLSLRERVVAVCGGVASWSRATHGPLSLPSVASQVSSLMHLHRWRRASKARLREWVGLDGEPEREAHESGRALEREQIPAVLQTPWGPSLSQLHPARSVCAERACARTKSKIKASKQTKISPRPQVASAPVPETQLPVSSTTR